MLSTEWNGMEKGGDLAAVLATLISTYFYSSVYRIWVRLFAAQQYREMCFSLRKDRQVVVFHPFPGQMH